MATVVSMPKLGFDMAEGTLVRWVRAVGEAVEKGEILAEIETDKATVEVEAVESGTVRKLLVQEGTAVPIGTPIAVLGTPDEPIDSLPELAEGATQAAEQPKPAASPAPAPVAPPAQPPVAEASGRVRASPLARRMAAEHALDLSRIRGSGPGGRVTKRDISAALQTGTTPTGARVPSAPSVTLPPRPERDEVIPASRLRQAIGRRMVAAKQQVPHFYLTADIDAAQLVSLRAEANAALPEETRLSFHDFVVRASALALRAFPALNASLDGDKIVRYAAVNVGSAVAVEGGLLTVIVRDADAKALPTISAEIREMAFRARDGRVRPDDIEGATFTVSNLGMFDVDEFIAIINPPETAILAVGSVRQVPVVEAGAVVAGWRMRVTLSADHRVTDGAEAARWLQHLRTYLEHPVRLFL
ncbi:MAG TPA: dihydrolipoamide acetyltransferase family protein [Anaerolineales bacterium]|nr:dihydrolipoamide acetyltransferase family protein [Anaerolineales bacterium]